jgi:potassium voltage-gated channel Eag-related subfamily H protein 7
MSTAKVLPMDGTPPKPTINSNVHIITAAGDRPANRRKKGRKKRKPETAENTLPAVERVAVQSNLPVAATKCNASSSKEASAAYVVQADPATPGLIERKHSEERTQGAVLLRQKTELNEDESGYFKVDRSMSALLSHDAEGLPMVLNEGKDYIFSLDSRLDRWRIVDPNTQRMNNWDVTMMMLLVFTAFVTPFEVAFLSTEVNALFWINRFIDMLFLCDLVLNFMISYPVFVRSTRVWIISPAKIAKRYLSSWFLIDLISILPYDILTVTGGGGNMGNLKMLRIVRCMRLLKIVKILKSFKKMEKMKEKAGVKFSTTKLLQFIVVLVGVSHWLSCLWMMVPSMESSDENWVTNYYGIKYASTDTVIDPSQLEGCDAEELASSGFKFCQQKEIGAGQLYLTCLYWAIMTLSTIGYGDVTPVTDAERFIAIVGMGIGAGVYAYLVGGICGILANRDPVTTEFHQTVDNLNNFMDEYDIPQAMKHKLRAFCFGTKQLFRARVHEGVLGTLSPQLRCDVICYVNEPWISKVALFNCLPPDERRLFLTECVVNMTTSAYALDEYVIRKADPVSNMYIVKEGMCCKVGKRGSHKLVLKFDVVGADVMVRNVLRSPYDLKTVMFSVICQLKKEDIVATLLHPRFNITKTYLRRVAMFKIFKEGFIRFAEAFKAKYGENVAFDHAQHNIRFNDYGDIESDDDDVDELLAEEMAKPATRMEVQELRQELKANQRDIKKWMNHLGMIMKSRNRM